VLRFSCTASTATPIFRVFFRVFFSYGVSKSPLLFGFGEEVIWSNQFTRTLAVVHVICLIKFLLPQPSLTIFNLSQVQYSHPQLHVKLSAMSSQPIQTKHPHTADAAISAYQGQVPDIICCSGWGDFYEFYEDAGDAAKLLDITLTAYVAVG
jgi:hypothetical protein